MPKPEKTKKSKKSKKKKTTDSVDSTFSIIGKKVNDSDEVVSWSRESVASDVSEVSADSNSSEETIVSNASEKTLNCEALESRRIERERSMREENKRYRSIYFDAGKIYGPDAQSKKELKKRRCEAVEIRKEQLAKTIQKLLEARNFDLCFVVDATGSMINHIAGVKNSIHDIVADLVKKYETNKKDGQPMMKRFAFVAYRDYDYPEQYKVLPFTTSVDEFYNFCNEISLPGDNTCNDFPEDVLGGLNKALSLDWSETDNTKVIFHICDQPPHGRQFHNDNYKLKDNYPDGDPSGLTAEGIFKQMASKEIDYYFGKVTEYTNRMIKCFDDVLGKPIGQFDIANVEKIATSVVSAVSISISNLLEASQRSEVSKKEEREYTLDPTIPDWKATEEQVGKFITYKLPESIKDVVKDVPLDRQRPKAARIQLAENPFAKGGERLAYYGRNSLTGKKIVLKEYRKNIAANESARRHELSNQLQTVASYFASLFMTKCEEKFGASHLPATIDFLMIKTLLLGTSANPRYMSCEQLLGADAHYIRFTNNYEFIMKETDVDDNDISLDLLHFVVCFSHWTYEVTGGKLMVVDLQGKMKPNSKGRPTMLLTDPSIHSNDRTRFGAMNLSHAGMSSFFENHKCNRFCKGLNLPEVDPDILLIG
ncbi:hypothetical protein M3Y94_00715800 [Aphelenchoides besseyi]|nr:hypothetical protein M3Y94_00715800 [Aphelenchoides besseyi]KAI6231754.1 hypothetical protein M3Y95_00415000 [Aphelenchoides besseyi]